MRLTECGEPTTTRPEQNGGSRHFDIPLIFFFNKAVIVTPVVVSSECRIVFVLSSIIFREILRSPRVSAERCQAKVASRVAGLLLSFAPCSRAEPPARWWDFPRVRGKSRENSDRWG